MYTKMYLALKLSAICSAAEKQSVPHDCNVKVSAVIREPLDVACLQQADEALGNARRKAQGQEVRKLRGLSHHEVYHMAQFRFCCPADVIDHRLC